MVLPHVVRDAGGRSERDGRCSLTPNKDVQHMDQPARFARSSLALTRALDARLRAGKA
jgi:hypothetical protein